MRKMNHKIYEYINEPSFDPALRKRILEWSSEANFVSFLNINSEKILKKLQTAKEKEDKYDVGLELYIGFIFSTSSCMVDYEPTLSIPKNPDFKISFDGLSFYCEATRLRNKIEGEISNERMYKKCGDIICKKVLQTVPNEINIIYIRNRVIAPDSVDLVSGFENLVAWARTDPDEFSKKLNKYKIASIDEFNDYLARVSAIIIPERSEEHTSELQSHSFISYAVFCLKKKKNNT